MEHLKLEETGRSFLEVTTCIARTIYDVIPGRIRMGSTIMNGLWLMFVGKT